MRGSLLALAAAVAFVALTAALAWRLYAGLPSEGGEGFWGPVAFVLLGAGVLIGFFLWLGRRRR